MTVRDCVINGSIATQSDPFPERIAWDGVSNFTHGPGLNWAELGFDRYRPWISPAQAKANWDTFTSELDSTGDDKWQRAEKAHCDVIRIAIDPQKFLETDGSPGALAPWIDVIKYTVDTVLAHGMKAIVDMHVGGGSDSDPLTNDYALLTGHRDGTPMWAKAKRCWIEIAKMLNAYATTLVAFEIYNESEEFSGVMYMPMIANLSSSIRGIVGYRTKHIIGGPYFAGHNGFENPRFKRNLFGPNVGIANHGGYYPQVFSHQGLNGNRPMQWIHRLPFFPVEADMDAKIAEFLAEAGSDGAAADDLAAGVSVLTDYYQNWQERAGYDGRSQFATAWPMNNIWGEPDPNTTVLGATIGKWMHDNGVVGADMHLTEIGVHRDFDDVDDRLGATVIDAARFIGLVRKYAVKGRGANGMILWNDETKHFTINENIAAPGDEPDYSGQIEPLIAIAAGLRGAWFPTFLGDRLDQWLDPIDAGTITFGVGSKVAQILDLSGNGKHEVQADPLLQPTLIGGLIRYEVGQYTVNSLSASDVTEWMFEIIRLDTNIAGNRTISGSSGAGGRQFRFGSGHMETLRQFTAYVSGPFGTVVANTNALVGVQYRASVHPEFGPLHRYHLNDDSSFDLIPSAGDFGVGFTSQTGIGQIGSASDEPLIGRIGGRIRGHGPLSEDDIEQIKIYLMERYP